MTTNLKFHTVINGVLQRADGRYPGWCYDIGKAGNHSWNTYFIDENDKSTELARGVNFARAKAAANAHHNHPGA